MPNDWRGLCVRIEHREADTLATRASTAAEEAGGELHNTKLDDDPAIALALTDKALLLLGDACVHTLALRAVLTAQLKERGDPCTPSEKHPDSRGTPP